MISSHIVNKEYTEVILENYRILDAVADGIPLLEPEKALEGGKIKETSNLKPAY